MNETRHQRYCNASRCTATFTTTTKLASSAQRHAGRCKSLLELTCLLDVAHTTMNLHSRLVVSFALFYMLVTVKANTEKTIFTAPPPAVPSPGDTNFSYRQLKQLTPDEPIIRASLDVTFPEKDDPWSSEHWYLLKHLKEGQRYEVRICWAAIQPTNFWLDVYGLNDASPDPSTYNSGRVVSNAQDLTSLLEQDDHIDSALLLRIRSAADFFTTNRTLMSSPHAVDVDIILDPYIANVFPRSLLPTAVYVICLALLAWYTSGMIWSYLLAAPVKEDKYHND